MVVKQNQPSEPQQQQKLEVQFCNSKSIELFGVDLMSAGGGQDDLYKAGKYEK